MAAKKKSTAITAAELLNLYTEYLLLHGKRPANVHQFCKDSGMEETDFYRHFASFAGIESAFFETLHTHTVGLLQQDAGFAASGDADQLLSYYFTFFEMATANRSYILMVLQDRKDLIGSLQQLYGLRKAFLEFAAEVLAGRTPAEAKSWGKLSSKALQEAAWAQFMMIFRFWMQDRSPGFEKTDVMIEKTVRAGFDVIDHIPMQSVVDLGKFLWKERPFQ